MIVTVTLNAAIDKSLAVPGLRLGHRHRAVENLTLAGGKGINIARALKQLEVPVIATGLTGGPTGTRIVEALTADAVLCDFVRIKDESRTNISLFDPTDGSQTEINEHGPAVSEQEIQLFRDKLSYLAKGASIVVFAGSLPRNVDPTIYATFIEDLRSLNVTTVIDAEGDPLLYAARAQPDLISPNVIESEELVGYEFTHIDDRWKALEEIQTLGPQEVIMTSPDGCFALLKGNNSLQRYCVRTKKYQTVASVGSGDAFLAGYLAKRYAQRPANECLQFAVACGSASTHQLGAGLIDLGKLPDILKAVHIENPYAQLS